MTRKGNERRRRLWDKAQAGIAAVNARRAKRRQWAKDDRDSWRTDVTVTLARRDSGELRCVVSGPGTSVYENLRAVLEPFDPAIWRVCVISTARTIMADLQRHAGHPRGPSRPEPQMLGSIGMKEYL